MTGKTPLGGIVAWSGFPTNYTMAALADMVSGYALAESALAFFVRKNS